MGEIVVLRLVHVVGGIFWVGSMMYLTFFLLPAIAELGPTAGQVMAALQRRKPFVWLPIVALLTIVSGLRLLMISSASFSASYLATPTGQAYLGAGVLAIIALVVGLVVNRPLMGRMMALSASLADADTATRERVGAEIAAVRSRARAAAVLVTWMLVVAAAGMAVGRYL